MKDHWPPAYCHECAMKRLKALGKEPSEGVSTAMLRKCSDCGKEDAIIPAYKYGL